MRHWRAVSLTALIVLLLTITTRYGNSVLIHFESDELSKSIGTPAEGALINGKRIPTSGNNFRTYSYLGSFIGRTCVHQKLRSAILDAYLSIYDKNPELRYVYAEASWPNGGPLNPHKTHKNGLAVDFMVPVKNKQGESRILPTSILNEYGYGYNFDENGNNTKFDIDFEALAKHLEALYDSCKSHGIYINLVIIAPEYLPLIFQSPAGQKLEGKFPFWRKQVEERHDEHYHVIFSIPDF